MKRATIVEVRPTRHEDGEFFAPCTEFSNLKQPTDPRMTETIDAAKAASAIVEYTRTEAALADLRQRFANVVWDVTTTAGDKAARAARKELVTLRTTLEATRKALKAPALEYSQRIDNEAKRITVEIVALEAPIDSQIKADEQRREADRQRKAEEDAKRIGAHQARIAEIHRLPQTATTATPAAIETMVANLAAMPIGTDFDEFESQAQSARTDVIKLLRELHRSALAREAEAARIVAERAELERLRTEQAERERVERERQAAEQARITAEQQAENSRQAAARAEIEAKERQQREQQRKLDEQAAALRAQELAAQEAAKVEQERQQRAQQERETAEAARREQEAAAARQRELDAAEQAADRVQAAAQQMLAALLQWQRADESNDAAAMTDARAARDIAIAAACA